MLSSTLCRNLKFKIRNFKRKLRNFKGKLSQWDWSTLLTLFVLRCQNLKAHSGSAANLKPNMSQSMIWCEQNPFCQIYQEKVKKLKAKSQNSAKNYITAMVQRLTQTQNHRNYALVDCQGS